MEAQVPGSRRSRDCSSSLGCSSRSSLRTPLTGPGLEACTSAFTRISILMQVSSELVGLSGQGPALGNINSAAQSHNGVYLKLPTPGAKEGLCGIRAV
ncbi:hypothetical protein A6R68_07261 [Neotoma lepida]|uniref:Uncharacterized protein n=1 Tax=Neotoma lepida TaxID=56216 RepID=A0A1A6GD76_NEOLE|nr:hypothetical protein A6R68_07261 [Neotoma lepida]